MSKRRMRKDKWKRRSSRRKKRRQGKISGNVRDKEGVVIGKEVRRRRKKGD